MTTGIKPGSELFIPDLGSLDQSRLLDKNVCTGEHQSAAPVLVRTDDSTGSWRKCQNSDRVLRVRVRVGIRVRKL